MRHDLKVFILKLFIVFGTVVIWRVLGYQNLVAYALIVLVASIPERDSVNRLRARYREHSKHESFMICHLDRSQRAWVEKFAGIPLGDAAVKVRALHGRAGADIELSIQLMIKPEGDEAFYNVTAENPIGIAGDAPEGVDFNE